MSKDTNIEFKNFKIIDDSILITPKKNQYLLEDYLGWVLIKEDSKYMIVFIKEFVYDDIGYGNNKVLMVCNQESDGFLRDSFGMVISFEPSEVLENVRIINLEGEHAKLYLFDTDIIYKLVEIKNESPRIRWYKKGRFEKFED